MSWLNAAMHCNGGRRLRYIVEFPLTKAINSFVLRGAVGGVGPEDVVGRRSGCPGWAVAFWPSRGRAL